MKALQINAPLPTTFGVDIPSGSVIIISESYVKQQEIAHRSFGENGSEKCYPCQIAFRVYASVKAYEDNLDFIQGLLMPTTMGELWIKESIYKVAPAETLIIAAVKEQLETLFPEMVEEIEL